MTETSMRLRQTYTRTLLLAGRFCRRVANGAAERHGLSDATGSVLLLIHERDGKLRQNAVADAIGIEDASLVRLVDQLCKAGFVVRTEDPADRRAKVLGVTPAGRRAAIKLEADLSELREAVFSEISDADFEASLRVFKALEDYVRRAPQVVRGEAA